MKEEIKKAHEKIHDFFKLAGEVKRVAIEAIYDIAMEHGGTLSFVGTDDSPFICYDGGNHIEYASNMSNEVLRIKAYTTPEGFKRFYCDTYEENDYDVERITPDDVFYLFDTVYICEEYGVFDETDENSESAN